MHQDDFGGFQSQFVTDQTHLLDASRGGGEEAGCPVKMTDFVKDCGSEKCHEKEFNGEDEGREYEYLDLKKGLHSDSASDIGSCRNLHQDLQYFWIICLVADKVQ